MILAVGVLLVLLVLVNGLILRRVVLALRAVEQYLDLYARHGEVTDRHTRRIADTAEQVRTVAAEIKQTVAGSEWKPGDEDRRAPQP